VMVTPSQLTVSACFPSRSGTASIQQ
jgi:hypothetical protein